VIANKNDGMARPPPLRIDIRVYQAERRWEPANRAAV